MNLTKLIADAWNDERAKYGTRYMFGPSKWCVVDTSKRKTLFTADTEAECEAHLSSLCARAVLRRMSEAGYAIVDEYEDEPVIPERVHDLRAALEQP